MLPAAPTASAFLVVISFAVAGTRLLITQFRQEHTLEDLRQSNELLHSIVEGTSEAVYLKDLEGRYLLMNSAGARSIGKTVEEVLGKTDRELFPPATLEVIRQSDQQVLTHGKPQTAQEVILTGAGSRTFLSTKNALRDAEGRITGVLGVSMDITERRRLEDQLRRAQRMEAIGAFSGAIAHDFNNLLTVIKGYSQLILSGSGKPQSRTSVQQIDMAADRAASLIRQLLAFSRQQILQPRVINLNDIVSNLQKMLHRLIGEDVQIATHLADDLWAVKADPGQIEQVLMNLAANARDAMPTGGRMTLETRNVTLGAEYTSSHADVTPGEYAVLAVSDTGMGMDAETQGHIFEPFFTTKPPGKGTGLGLATVYGIVKQSGGHIWLYSEPGAGTTFKIYRPRANEPVEYLTGAMMPVPVTRRGHETVMLVEDDAQLRELTHAVLVAAGYTVLAADGADQAQTVAGQHRGPIHLLLTDVVMSGMGGREVARNICGKRSETRVLYMSGYTGDAIVHHGVLDAGISFLQKPFTPTALIERVREVLDAPARND